MDDLKQFFRSALSTRIEALETAATTMEADPVGALGTIRRLAHSLRGSGATYGFPQITEAATALEEAEPEEVPPLLRELVKTLKSVVNELRDPPKEAGRAAAGSSPSGAEVGAGDGGEAVDGAGGQAPTGARPDEEPPATGEMHDTARG